MTPQERAERRARVQAERRAAEERRAREKKERDKFLSFLALAFPKAIFVDRDQRVPLKIGIAQDILDKLQGMDAQWNYFNKQRYKMLHNYCHSIPYLEKLAAGVPRVDLEGNVVSEIEEEHRENARKEIERIRSEIDASVEKAKRQAAAAKRRAQKNNRRPGGGQRRFNGPNNGGPGGFRPNYNRGGYQQGGYQQQGGYRQGGYQQGGYQQGGYQQQGGYRQGGYQQGNRYQQGGYQPQSSGGTYQNRYQQQGATQDANANGPRVMHRTNRVFTVKKPGESS